MNEQIKKKIEHLRDKIREHDYRYYALSDPSVSDKEYDELISKLRRMEEEYPEYKTKDSPTVRIGSGMLDGFKTVGHKQKMLSLDNTYSFLEVEEWNARIKKGLGSSDDIEYVVELKIDGVSANLSYESSRLVIAATRGDGQTGEDVTENIKTIRAIPLVLHGENLPSFIEVRGEVYMDKKEFSFVNKQREYEGEVLFANPRNATSGSLKLLDTSLVAKRRLNFFAHSLGEYKGENIKTQWDFLKLLREWGFSVNPSSRLCKSIKEVIDYCGYWQEKRDELVYEIDGVVVKLNNMTQQDKLGSTLKSPRWAIAYKFPARQATTEVLRININVGRTGVITPTAKLAPVECAGVVIKHATLHNFDEIERLKLREGDRVLIERAGDVIPKIVKVVESKGKKDFLIPKKCPACSSRIVKEKEEDVAYRCMNSSCPAQLQRSLLHFASRQAIDIEGMGESVVSQLVELGIVKNVADIYKLTEKELSKLELFKEKKIKNLLSAIEKSKSQSLSRLIYGLGIRHVGEKAAYVLAKHFGTMDRLMHAKTEDLDKIYEVGSVMAQSIRNYFLLEETKETLADLKKYGLSFKEEVLESRNTLFFGKKFIFTGELDGLSRLKAEELVRRLGGNLVSSVSKNTDFVVVGTNPGSKYNKAKELGIKIITEREFKEMLEWK